MRGNRQVLLLVATLLFTAPTAAVETFELVVDGGRIETEVLPGQLMVSRDELLQWIEVAAHTVSRYYGRFPVSRARLRLVPVKGKSIRGTTWGGATPFIRVSIGDRVTSDELGADWNLTHELERIFVEADQAVGEEVLSTLYAQIGVRYLPVDLNQLWLDLGVQSSEGRLVLDDSAPKAAIRQAITR